MRATGRDYHFPVMRPTGRPGTSIAALLGVTALAGALALFRIGVPSLWFDEAFSVDMVRKGFALLDDTRGIDVSGMAVYYALLAPWITVSLDEGWIRLLSALFVIAAVPVTWLVARRLFDERVATIAAVLLCVNAFTIRYAQEARGYAPLLFLAALSTYLLVRAIERPTWWSWLAYGLAAALIPYTQLLGSTLLVVHAVGAVSASPRPPWSRLALAASIVAVALVPMASSAFRMAGGAVPWVPGVSFDWVATQLLALGGGEVSSGPDSQIRAVVAAAALGLAGAGAVVATGLVPGHRRTWASGFILLWLLGPIVISIVVSLAKPILVARYLMGMLPALAISGALAIEAIPRARWRAAALVGALAIAAVGVVAYYHDPERPDWRGVTAFMASKSSRDDRWLADPTWSWRPVTFYVERDVGAGAFPGRLWRGLDSTDRATYPDVLARTADALALEGRAIWLVVTGSSAGTTDVLTDPKYAPFLERYRAAETRTFDRVTVIRFEPIV
jgi:mannosyltransferase